MSPGITTGVGGASLDWDRRRRVTPVQTASQEAWPEAEPLGWNNSLRREPRWNADKRARSEWARAASQDAAVGDLRLPAFRFLHFLRLIGRSRNNGRSKVRPHPCPLFGPDRFRVRRDSISLGRDPFPIAHRKTRAPRRAARRERMAMRDADIDAGEALPRPRLKHRLDRDMRPR